MAGQIIKRGKDTWLIRVFLGRDENGKRNYANETFRGTKKKAQERLTEMLSDVNNGVFVKPQKISLNAYLDQWLDVVKPRLSERTHDDYTYLLKRYVRASIGARILTDISAADIQVLYAKMSEAGLSPRIVRYVHTVLSAALKKAVKLTLLRFDPTSVVELPKQTRKEIKAFSPEEATCFLDAAKEDRHGVLLALALATGMRPEEYFGLQWKDVDWKQGTVIVQRALIWRTKGGGWYFSETKTSRSRRTIPLPPSMIPQLKEHKRRQAETRLRLGPAYQNHDLVFATDEGGPLSIQNFTFRHYKPTLKKAGLPEAFTLYSFRHSCATLLLSAGENPKIVSERLGHSSVAITLDTYSHVLPHMQKSASDKLEKMLFSKVGTLSAHKSETGTPESARNSLQNLMARDGIEPPTHGFSVRCSTN